MGVQVRLVLYAPSENAAVEAATAAYQRIAALEDVMSDYRPDSELMRLCARAGSGPVAVSDDLFRVLAVSQELARRSAGAFDVTVGPYVRLWREARKQRRLPDAGALREAAARVGWEKVRLDPRLRTVELTTPGMQLDLGGIAKGYAADEMRRVLAAHGVVRVLIELGGDFVVGAPPPERAGWQIEIENADEAHRTAVLANAAISSSGDTMQYVEVDGVRYSHIVDPRTGLGLTTRIAATVVGPSAFTTDGLATLLCVLGDARGAPLVHQFYPEVSVHVRRADTP